MNKILLSLSFCLVLTMTLSAQKKSPEYGELEIVAQLDICPGNVAISTDGRLFSSVHPLRRGEFQLIEITGEDSYELFPNESWNARPGSGPDVINSPLGVIVDENNWLWVIDGGNALPKPLQPKLLAFDVNTRKLMYRYDFPDHIAPVGSFLQDLVVDTKNQFVYMADLGGENIQPAIVALNYASGKALRFEDDRLLPEEVEMIVDGESKMFLGKPARVGINPITLSADGETLYFGSMSGTKFYSAKAEFFRQFRSQKEIATTVREYGPKPVSDGSTIDQSGNIYITNLENNSLDVLRPNGKLETIVKEIEVLDWPDNTRLGADGWIYMAVNQLQKTKAFNNGEEKGEPPYLIVRVFVGEGVVWGR